MADLPTNRFSIPITKVLVDLDGNTLKEPGPDGAPREVTLGMLLGAAMLSDAKDDGVPLTVLDRLDLARRFRGTKAPEIKVETLVHVKKLVAKAYEKAPLLSGQALELLGDEPSKDL